MTYHILNLAALTGKDLGHLIGFLVVTTTLILLWAMTAGVGRLFASGSERKKQKAEARQAAAAKNTTPSSTSAAMTQQQTATSSAGKTDPGVLAAISAAVHVALGGRKVRIVSVQPVRSEWGRFGRLRIFNSHKLR